MPPRIALLPDAVINQIAAGEVIERPASVVKELVENAIDAGARQVLVEMELGGMRLIRVHDDGCGIARDELALALCRHATSKLRAIDDLNRLSSLGFRGEALPSIGSVSRLTLTSNAEGEATAWSVSMSGADRISEPQPAARVPGTTVEVRELFHCVPARRRFLKTERTEFLHAQDWLRRTALARPQVDLSLVHNGQRVLSVRAVASADALPARIERVAGAAFMRHARRVDASVDGLALHGWVAPAQAARNQSDLQYWLVNGRPVRDVRLLHAVRLAYEDALPDGRHAAFVLYLDLDPATVDVNVHPAKTEVRFLDARRVHDFVFSAVRRALVSPDPPTIGAPLPSVAEPALRYTVRRRESSAPAARALRPSSQCHAEPIAAIAGSLLLVRRDDDIWLLDPERAIGELWAAGEAIESRPLIFPTSLPVDAAAGALIRRFAPLLTAHGVEIDTVDDGIVRVRAVPAWLGREVQRLVTAVLSVLDAAPPDPAPALRGAMARLVAAAVAADLSLAAKLVGHLDRVFDPVQLTHRRIARRIDAVTLRQWLDDDG
jgi:DNA mismatch repair protein MutL